MATRWHTAPHLDDWLAQALAWVGHAEAEALARHGTFHLVLAGGSTPRRLYQALARHPHHWTRWQVWLGDERCLPATDAGRNSVMARDSLLDHVPIPPARFHPIPAELGPDAAAAAYGAALHHQDEFDLVLLGLGEDGHTASLFPDHDWGADDQAADVLPVRGAPKPPAERVSLSARRLSRARHALFLVSGPDKQRAVARWRQGEPIPASAIQPPGGVDVLLTTDSLPSGEPR